MKKNVWILNHYGATMLYQQGGRHYWMAKELLKNGYHPVFFCANVVHNSKDTIEIDGVYRVAEQDGIIFVLVKTPSYTGNGRKRFNNILWFYRNVKIAMKKYRKEKKVKPDVILASHVHPLTCVAGIQMGKRWNVSCIVEIRDLWPAELIAIGAITEKSLAASLLYRLEKYLYQKADAVVFTIAGGAKYISDKKWDKDQGGTIDLSKIFYPWTFGSPLPSCRPPGADLSRKHLSSLHWPDSMTASAKPSLSQPMPSSLQAPLPSLSYRHYVLCPV